MEDLEGPNVATLFIVQGNKPRLSKADEITLPEKLTSTFNAFYKTHLKNAENVMKWLQETKFMDASNAYALERVLKIINEDNETYGSVASSIQTTNFLLDNNYNVHLYCMKLWLNRQYPPRCYNYMPLLRPEFTFPDMQIMSRVFKAQQEEKEVYTSVPQQSKELLRMSLPDTIPGSVPLDDEIMKNLLGDFQEACTNQKLLKEYEKRLTEAKFADKTLTFK